VVAGTHTSMVFCFSVAATGSGDSPAVLLGCSVARSRCHGLRLSAAIYGKAYATPNLQYRREGGGAARRGAAEQPRSGDKRRRGAAAP
jgi:hypothetical protein